MNLRAIPEIDVEARELLAFENRKRRKHGIPVLNEGERRLFVKGDPFDMLSKSFLDWDRETIVQYRRALIHLERIDVELSERFRDSDWEDGVETTLRWIEAISQYRNEKNGIQMPQDEDNTPEYRWVAESNLNFSDKDQIDQIVSEMKLFIQVYAGYSGLVTTA